MISINSQDQNEGYVNLRFQRSETYGNKGLCAAAGKTNCKYNEGVNAGLVSSTCETNFVANIGGFFTDTVINRGLNLGLGGAECSGHNLGANIGGILGFSSENQGINTGLLAYVHRNNNMNIGGLASLCTGENNSDNFSLAYSKCGKVKFRTVQEAMPTFTKWGLVPKKLRDKKFPSTNLGLVTKTDNPQGAFIGGYLGGFSLFNYINNIDRGQYVAAGLINVIKDESGYHVSPIFSANITIPKHSKLETIPGEGRGIIK